MGLTLTSRHSFQTLESELIRDVSFRSEGSGGHGLLVICFPFGKMQCSFLAPASGVGGACGRSSGLSTRGLVGEPWGGAAALVSAHVESPQVPLPEPRVSRIQCWVPRALLHTALLALGLQAVVLTACQSQGLVTTTRFFLKLFTYSVICLFVCLCPLNLFVGSSQHQEDRNKQLKCLTSC